jgi:NTP pyrophosphatase (non-canonical NTP hydrolase)
MTKETYDLLQYQQEAVYTKLYPEDKCLEYCALGLIGETGELLGKTIDAQVPGSQITVLDINKEIGDVFWYIVAMAEDLDSEAQKIEAGPRSGIVYLEQRRTSHKILTYKNTAAPLSIALMEFAEICEKVKKLLRKDKPFTIELYHFIIEKLGNGLTSLLDVMEIYNLTFEQIAKANIEKLASRADRGVLQGDGDNR